MIILMRTTLILDDALVRAAKQKAARAGITLSALVAHALRDALAARERDAPRFEMITYGRRGRGVRHEPADFARAFDAEDAARVGR